MIKYLMLLIAFSLSFSGQSENLTSLTAAVKKEKTWWQLRKDRSDIFYPHKPHIQIIKKEGDACMLCHPFSANITHKDKELKKLNKINNEPLESICHDCHVEKNTAPSECRLCHPDPSSIWPQDHNYNYINLHVEDAQADQQSCNECHKQLSFCIDCHFKRNYSGGYSGIRVHKLGYKLMHGLDARVAPAECGSCHQANYCRDCHRRRR